MDALFENFELLDIPKLNLSQFQLSDKVTLLILLRSADKASHEDLLVNILKSIGFIIGQNAEVISLSDQEDINVARVATDSVKHVISFGLKPRHLGLNASFKPNTFYPTETFHILLSYAMNDLNVNKAYKKALWLSLQKAFK